MMTEKRQPFLVRCYLANPGGAYDPAPLHELDLDTEDGGQLPQVGDILRWDETRSAYRVVARYFDLSAKHCALEVVEHHGRWTGL